MSDGSFRLAPIPLRLALGTVLCFHGYKMFHDGGDPQHLIQAFKSFDVPNQDVLAKVATWGLLAGGGMILIGLMTRLAALLNAALFFIAIWKVDLGSEIANGLKDVPSYQFPLMILAACWALLLMGGGALSVDGLFGRSRPSPPKP